MIAGVLAALTAAMLVVVAFNPVKDERGDYIIGKEDDSGTPRILVARNIEAGGKAQAVPTPQMMQSRKVDLVYYLIGDRALFNDLNVGERVAVRPKTSRYEGRDVYVTMQSWPPQIAAGEVVRFD